MAIEVVDPVKLGGSELAITPALTTLRTVPSGSKDLIKDVTVANNGAGAAVVSLYLVPSGDSASNDNILIPAVSIPINTFIQWEGLQVLESGGTIQANSDIVDVCAHISGGNAV